MKPDPRLCTFWESTRGRRIGPPKNWLKNSSYGSRTDLWITRSVLMFTTAGIALPTALTAGSEAGSDWAWRLETTRNVANTATSGEQREIIGYLGTGQTRDRFKCSKNVKLMY